MVRKIPERLAVTSIAADLFKSGWKPALYRFPVPQEEVIFQVFAPFTKYAGNDLHQIIIEDVRQNADKYEPMARDFWKKKGQTLGLWCDIMENSLQPPDEVILQFTSVFVGKPAAVLLKDHGLWTTGASMDITDYELVFLYEGNGVFQLTISAEVSSSNVLLHVLTTDESLPVHNLWDRKTTCRRSEHGSSNVSFKHFFASEKQDTGMKKKDLPAALKGPPSMPIP